jgi:hypothetical protein
VLAKSGTHGTTHIGVKAATNAFHAARFATATGRPFTLVVTINWDRLGIADELAMKAFRQVRDKLRRHWRYLRERHGPGVGRLECVGAHENPNGRRNTHWLVAVPAPWAGEFQRSLEKYLAKVADADELGAALHVKPIHAVGGAVKYAMKGVEAAYQDYFWLDARDQGFIAGRGRTFVSRDISQAARKRAGWTRRRRPSARRSP